MQTKLYGLIGFPLGHSFSKGYFTEKFQKMGVSETHLYEKFEISTIDQFPKLIEENPNLAGINVTIPYKQAIIPFLDGLDDSAVKVGAVNVIKFIKKSDAQTELIGYNSDYYGFKKSLEDFLKNNKIQNADLKALILGNGGAAKAVMASLKDLNICYKIVSRTKTEDNLIYEELASFITDYQLIINTSPVGTYPKTEECPKIPYQLLTEKHLLYDLVYNPAETLFLKKGKKQGCPTQNGLPMLHLQAEKAWDIWSE
jgi:shikimate dehydrogenase